MKRPYSTLYFSAVNSAKPQSRGHPKHEDGSIEGAAKAVARGYVRKVQCIDREKDRVLWTVKAGERVRGIHIIPVLVERGEGNESPTRRNNNG